MSRHSPCAALGSADDWLHAPPFPNDAAYAGSIQGYRETILAGYRKTAADQGVTAGFGTWFKTHEAFLNEHGGVDAAGGAVSTMLGLLEGDVAMIADMGALNRWPGRSGVPQHELRPWGEELRGDERTRPIAGATTDYENLCRFVSDPTTVCADTRRLHHRSAETASTSKVEKVTGAGPAFFRQRWSNMFSAKKKEIGH